MGNARPFRLKPVPVTDAREIVDGEFPEFVSVAGTVAVAPTCTLPKLTLPGVTDRLAVAPEMPVPTSETRADVRRLPVALKVRDAAVVTAVAGE